MQPIELYKNRFYPYKLNPYRLLESRKRRKRCYIDITKGNYDKIISKCKISIPTNGIATTFTHQIKCSVPNPICDHRDIEIKKLKEELYRSTIKHQKEAANLQEKLSSLSLQLIELQHEQVELAKYKNGMIRNVTSNVNIQTIVSPKKKKNSIHRKNNFAELSSSKRKAEDEAWNINNSKTKTEESVPKKGTNLCRFYQSQKCYKGVACKYKHKKLCYFYNNSTCKNDKSCEYLHQKINCQYGNECTAKFCPFMHDISKKRRNRNAVSKHGSVKKDEDMVNLKTKCMQYNYRQYGQIN